MASSDPSNSYALGDAAGPYDITQLSNTPEELAQSHIDLGSVLIPVVEGGQVSVEMTVAHQPEAVYLITPVGRITVAAYAAPKSPGQWRDVVRELAESIRAEGATVRVDDEHWGREIVAEVPGEVHRFIGVDGPRWMLRCIASGPAEHGEHMAQLARAVLAETVVRRGDDPYPPREPLPVTLPQILADQVASAQQQMAQRGAFEPDNMPPGVQTRSPNEPTTDEIPVITPDSYGQLPPQPGPPIGQPLQPAPPRQPAPAPPVDSPPTSGSALQRLRKQR